MMHSSNLIDYLAQSKLVGALVAKMQKLSISRRVRLVETHISWVILDGNYAYKIKKNVDLGFLNYSTLQNRHNCCEEEIRLNKRLAPDLYLDVITVSGTPENPVLGGKFAIEYAVRMRRFATSKQFDQLARANKISIPYIDILAAVVANFHCELAPAIIISPFATPRTIKFDAEQNFKQLKHLLVEKTDLDKLKLICSASNFELNSCRSLIEQRRSQGFIRECHGDLHLGNIVLFGERPTPYDCIEFNAALRWIDVISEVAFTTMDLVYHQHDGLAYRFLNAYLEITGDYAGIRLLRFYMAYRAMVRAKVQLIRVRQLKVAAPMEARMSFRQYMDLALNCLKHKRAALIITHGLPGSGKTTFSQVALERLHGVRIRSDVERKRMFGLHALANSSAAIGVNMYSAEVTQRTYDHLYELAHSLLMAGYTVIVDAAFLKKSERDNFRRLAEEILVPFVIASLQAKRETLLDRVKERSRTSKDASEADINVLKHLAIEQECILPEESNAVAVFGNEGVGFEIDQTGWRKLLTLLT